MSIDADKSNAEQRSISREQAESAETELKELVHAVWKATDHPLFFNWLHRQMDEYLKERKSAGGTLRGFWEWLNKVEATKCFSSETFDRFLRVWGHIDAERADYHEAPRMT